MTVFLVVLVLVFAALLRFQWWLGQDLKFWDGSPPASDLNIIQLKHELNMHSWLDRNEAGFWHSLTHRYKNPAQRYDQYLLSS